MDEVQYVLTPIGRIRTPFAQKFGIPRQPGLVDASGTLEIHPPWDRLEYFDGLEEISHLWVLFLFHESLEQGWRGRVRPPRLGGNLRRGVFATRSPFRPNHIGMSVVRLDGIHHQKGRRVKLEVSGVDMLDRSPLLDIKPYVPYADSVNEATGGFAEQAPEATLEVHYLPEVEAALLARPDGEGFIHLLRSVIALDPRPAYVRGRDGGREYRMRFQDMEVRWIMDDDERNVLVVGVEPVAGPNETL